MATASAQNLLGRFECYSIALADSMRVWFNRSATPFCWGECGTVN